MSMDDGKSSFPPLPREAPNKYGVRGLKLLLLALAAQLALVFVMPLTMFCAAAGFSVGGSTGGVAVAGNPVATAFRWLLTLCFVPALVQGVKGIRYDEKNRLAKIVTIAVSIITLVWIFT